MCSGTNKVRGLARKEHACSAKTCPDKRSLKTKEENLLLELSGFNEPHSAI